MFDPYKPSVITLNESSTLSRESQWAELEAEALLGSAQVAIAQEQWGKAEELLALALKAAEGEPRAREVFCVLGCRGVPWMRAAGSPCGCGKELLHVDVVRLGKLKPILH